MKVITCIFVVCSFLLNVLMFIQLNTQQSTIAQQSTINSDLAVWRLLLNREIGTDTIQVIESHTLMEFDDSYLVFEELE